MAVSQKLTKQLDGLDTLREIVEMVKDPKTLIAAHEEARKQMALTVEQSKQVDDAKTLISTADNLRKELSDKQSQLEYDKQAHLDNIKNFNTHVETEEARIVALQDSLNAQSIALIAAKDAHLDAVAKLSSDRKNAELTVADNARKVQEDAVNNEKQRIVNANEAARLAELSAKLRDKAAKLSEALAD